MENRALRPWLLLYVAAVARALWLGAAVFASNRGSMACVSVHVNETKKQRSHGFMNPAFSWALLPCVCLSFEFFVIFFFQKEMFFEAGWMHCTGDALHCNGVTSVACVCRSCVCVAVLFRKLFF